jgi:glutathione S-transferase
MEIELYYTPHTRSLRPRWLLEELEIPYTLRLLDFNIGEAFTCADIMIGSTLNWLPDMLEPYPALQAYVQRISSRAAYARATQPVNTD